ncbi:hypothetical protein L4D00_02570, partial [Photobacterium swingsii]
MPSPCLKIATSQLVDKSLFCLKKHFNIKLNTRLKSMIFAVKPSEVKSTRTSICSKLNSNNIVVVTRKDHTPYLIIGSKSAFYGLDIDDSKTISTELEGELQALLEYGVPFITELGGRSATLNHRGKKYYCFGYIRENQIFKKTEKAPPDDFEAINSKISNSFK